MSEIRCMGGERIEILGPWSDGHGHAHAVLSVLDGDSTAGAMLSPSNMRALAAALTKAADACTPAARPPGGRR